MNDGPIPKAPGNPIHELLEIMAKLRDPAGGCPWDIEQTFSTIAPYTIEEAYEVAEAIARGNMEELRDELGDLLFQVVFYAQMARERGDFTFDDIVRGISEKMIRRHPHVFGDADVGSAEAQTVAWEEHKARERAEKDTAGKKENEPKSALDGVITALPALSRAYKLQKRAARVGFDWDEPSDVIAKIREELDELEEALKDTGGRPAESAKSSAAVREETGDLLFAVVNLARQLGVDPESPLRDTNRKFERRFRKVEAWLREDGKTPGEASLEDMEALWSRAKDKERGR